jgi:hypothetical protein
LLRVLPGPQALLLCWCVPALLLQPFATACFVCADEKCCIRPAWNRRHTELEVCPACSVPCQTNSMHAYALVVLLLLGRFGGRPSLHCLCMQGACFWCADVCSKHMLQHICVLAYVFGPPPVQRPGFLRVECVLWFQGFAQGLTACLSVCAGQMCDS